MVESKVVVVARIKAKPGHENAVKEELLSLVSPTRKERGCLNYDLHQSPEDKTVFLFHETWRSKADLDTHLTSPHIKTLGDKAPNLLDGPPVITLWKQID